MFYHILFVSARIGPWTWTEPSADEKRRGLQRASPWRGSVRRGQTSPFNLPRAAAGSSPSLFSLHNPTSKHWRQSRFPFLRNACAKKGRGKKNQKKHKLERWEWRKVISQFPWPWKTFCHSLLVKNPPLWIKSPLVSSWLQTKESCGNISHAHNESKLARMLKLESLKKKKKYGRASNSNTLRWN